MKKQHSLILTLVLLFSANQNVTAQIGTKLHDIRHDKFLNFFSFDTTKAFRTSAFVVRPFAPKFKKSITLEIKLGEDSVITSLELGLQKGFLDTDWIAARDIAKNFLRQMTEPRDSLLINDLANQIEFVIDRDVLYAGGVPKLPAEPTADYLAFIGKTDSYTKQLSHTELQIKNATRDKIPWLTMRLVLIARTGAGK
ncbi:MAG: hypothetical protein ABI444_07055 [Candidatus Kapaibacterium sp.]|jgi:hypothetical protein